MDNVSVATALCTAICSSFYPDKATIEIALFNAGINPKQIAHPKDKGLLRVAVSLVRGYVETSRSEGGISVSVDSERIKQSIRTWCKAFDADVEEICEDELASTIEDGSNMW